MPTVRRTVRCVGCAAVLETLAPPAIGEVAVCGRPRCARVAVLATGPGDVPVDGHRLRPAA